MQCLGFGLLLYVEIAVGLFFAMYHSSASKETLEAALITAIGWPLAVIALVVGVFLDALMRAWLLWPRLRFPTR
jgi:hypothetical protein